MQTTERAYPPSKAKDRPAGFHGNGKARSYTPINAVLSSTGQSARDRDNMDRELPAICWWRKVSGFEIHIAFAFLAVLILVIRSERRVKVKSSSMRSLLAVRQRYPASLWFSRTGEWFYKTVYGEQMPVIHIVMIWGAAESIHAD